MIQSTMAHKGPALSVIVPTYGRDDSVQRLLRALETQTLLSLEILIVDQNAKGYLQVTNNGSKHKTIHLHQDSPNVSAARNFGFVASSAPYVLFLDDDFLPEPDFCARGVSILKSYPDVHCVCPNIVALQELDNSAPTYGPTSLATEPVLVHMEETHSAAMFFERSYFRATGGFDEFIFAFARAGEDKEFYLRIYERKMVVWMDKALQILHDESVPGGCELRTEEYWRSRYRSICSWTFRHRIHAERQGRLRLRDMVALLRPTVLNRNVFRRSIRDTMYEFNLLQSALKESKAFLSRIPPYPPVVEVDHLQSYMNKDVGLLFPTLCLDNNA